MKGIRPQQLHKETLFNPHLPHFSNVLDVLGHLRATNSHLGSLFLQAYEGPSSSLALSHTTCLGPSGDRKHPILTSSPSLPPAAL